MKRNINIAMLLMFSITLLSSTCSSDDDSNQPNTTVNIQEVINTAESGTWVITYFFDTDEEETNNFNGYNFSFNNDGSLVATNNSTTIEGSWSVTNSGSNDDSSNDVDFNISFISPPNFEELSDDWDIIQYSSNMIELIDVSGGNGGTDYLTFEKI